MDVTKHFDLIFNSLAEGVCVHELVADKNGVYIDYRILRVNEAYTRILGIEAGEAENSLGSHLYKQKTAPFLSNYVNAVKENKTVDFEAFFAPMNMHFRIIVAPEPPSGFITIFTDLSRERQHENKFEELKQSFDLAFKSGNIGIWEFDLENNVLLWDDWMYKMYDVRPDDFGNTYEAWSKYLHPEDKKKTEQEVEDAIAGKTDFNTEFRIITPLGEIRYLRAFAAIIRDDDGKALKMTGANYNVTRERKLFRELTESEEKFRILADTTPAAIMLYQDDYWVYVNPAAELITEYKRTELLKMKFWEFVHPDDRELVKFRGRARQLSQQIETRYEFRIITKQGKHKWVSLSGSSVYFGGKPAGIITVIDIDKRKKAEDALQESFNELTKITENIPNAIWKSEITKDGSFINTYISDNINHLLALPENTIGNSWDEYFARVKPEFLPGIRRKFAKGVKNPGKVISYEYQVLKGDGSVAWFISEGRAYIDDGLVKAFGYTSDVSERRQHEQEMHLKERAIQASVDGIAVLDASQNYAYLNPSHANIFGYSSPDELIGKSWHMLYGDEELHRVKSEIMPEFISTGVWRGEAVGKKKDGSLFDQELSLTALDNGGLISIVRDISSRKKIEIALLESERNLKAVFNNTHQLFIMVDREYRIISLNKVAHEYYSHFLNIDVGPGMDIREIIYTGQKGSLEENFMKALDGQVNTIVYDLLFQKEQYWFSCSYHPVYGQNNKVEKVVISILDISDQKRFELELLKSKEKAEESEQKVRNMFKNTLTGILFCNNKGEILEANPAVVTIMGSPSLEASLKINLLNYEPLKEVGISQNLKKSMDENVIISDEALYTSRFNKKVYMQYSIVPFEYKGEVIGAWANINDLTELYETQRHLVEAKEKAEEGDRLKSAFLANMSHEIRTPMNGILGFADLLKSPDLSVDEKTQYLDVIQRSGRRMLNIINDLVEISRIESGQIKMNTQLFRLEDLLTELNLFFSREAEGKGLKIQLDPKCLRNDFLLRTDKQKLNQILTNLLKNAIKFTEDGSVTFGCHCKGKELLFFVKDTGVGIPSDMQNLIFDRFRQVNDEYTKMIEGTGLGLSISKAYVELLGGKIWCESELGKGSGFYFTLPDCKASEQECIPEKEADSVEIVHPLRILLAEDDPNSVRLYKSYVKNLNIELICAGNGEEALEILRTDDAFDLMLLDVKMPLKNGFEVLSEVKKVHSHIPVIMQSAFASNSDRVKAMRSGCVDYITKPVSKQKLVNIIHRHTNKT